MQTIHCGKKQCWNIFRYLHNEKMRTDAISGKIKKLNFWLVLRITKMQIFGKFKYFKIEIAQKKGFFLLVVGRVWTGDLSLISLALWLLCYSGWYFKKQAQNPKMTEGNYCNSLNIEIQDMTSRPKLIRTVSWIQYNDQNLIDHNKFLHFLVIHSF